jgi:hypothetical protein
MGIESPAKLQHDLVKGETMSEIGVQSLAEPAKLNQWERLADTFIAPSKTFEDIKRGNKSWWLPFIIAILVTYVFFAGITMRIGWAQVAENVMHLNPKAEAKLAQAPEAQRETTMKFTQYSMEGGFAASPILFLLVGAVIAVVMWGTINFMFGGRATFPAVFAVYMYASLPGIIKAALGTIVIFAGLAPESFNIANPAPTSLGAFLNPQDVGPAIYKLASSLDVTTIWYLVLLGMGIAIVAGVKRSSGYIASFGWWAIIVLFGVGVAAIRG